MLGKKLVSDYLKKNCTYTSKHLPHQVMNQFLMETLTWNPFPINHNLNRKTWCNA